LSFKTTVISVLAAASKSQDNFIAARVGQPKTLRVYMGEQKISKQLSYQWQQRRRYAVA